MPEEAALDGVAADLMAEVPGRLTDGLVAGRIIADTAQGVIARRVQGVRVWDGWLDRSRRSFSAP